MLPALVALGGTLLLFPATLPTTLRGALAFSAVIACAVIAAVASLWIYRLLRDISLLRAIALIATVNALAFILRAAFLQTNPLTDSAIPPELLLGLAYELPLLALTVWLMARVDPVRLSARFLLVPLVTVLEGAVLLRTPLAVRTIVAITIMAIGGLLVLLRRVPQQMPKLLPEK
jgi:drug/metabolite transporter (DMT)-like permease